MTAREVLKSDPTPGGRTIRHKSPLVIFAPLPPLKNGIADYVSELMPFHLVDFDVTVVVADEAPMPAIEDAGPRILLATEFRKHRSFFESATKLYHVGNNPDHCYMLDFISRDRGIIVLHDFNLNYMHEMATIRWREPDRYLSMMQREYGSLGRDIVQWQFDLQHREVFAGYELPLNGDVLEAATSVVTHSRHVQYKAAARVPRTPVWYVPHHLSPSYAAYAQLPKPAVRARIGLPQDEVIIVAQGFVTRAKQIPMILAALAELRPRVPPFRFVLAGDRRPAEYDVDADIAAFRLGDRTICTDYLDERQFFNYLAASDIVANLRYPSAGEMSGTLIRALGMGKPTIILDCGPMAELPDSIVKKVAWDDNTQATLTKALHGLMTDKSSRLGLGTRAAAYVRNVHGVEKIAGQYAQIIRRAAASRRTDVQTVCSQQSFGSPASVARRVHALPVPATSQQSDGRLWWQTGATPFGQEGHRALVISPHPDHTAQWLSDIFDWPSDSVTAIEPEHFLSESVRASDGTAVPAASFTFALVAMPTTSLSEEQAALLMRRLNYALCFGGSVAFETWTSIAQPEQEMLSLGETDLVRRLSDAGFTSVRRYVPEDGLFAELLFPDAAQISNLRFSCVAACKVSDYSVWRFVDSPAGLPMRLGGRPFSDRVDSP